MIRIALGAALGAAVTLGVVYGAPALTTPDWQERLPREQEALLDADPTIRAASEACEEFLNLQKAKLWQAYGRCP